LRFGADWRKQPRHFNVVFRQKISYKSKLTLNLRIISFEDTQLRGSAELYFQRVSFDCRSLLCMVKTSVSNRHGDGLYISAPHLGHGLATRTSM